MLSIGRWHIGVQLYLNSKVDNIFMLSIGYTLIFSKYLQKVDP